MPLRRKWRKSVTSPAPIRDRATPGHLAGLDSRPPTRVSPAWHTVTSDSCLTRVDSTSPCCGARPRCPRSSGAGAAARLVPAAVAAEQLDLDGVHRVDVRVAELDRAAQHRLPLEQPRDARRGEDARDRPRVLLFDRREQAVVAHERAGSRARSAGSTSRASSRGCRPPCGRTAAARRDRAASSSPASANAVPLRTTRGAAPGSASTRTPTGSPAARRGIRHRPACRAGRDAISSIASSSTGVNARKNSTNDVVLPDECAVGRARDRGSRSSSARSSADGGGVSRSGMWRAACPASAASRFWRARPAGRT